MTSNFFSLTCCTLLSISLLSFGCLASETKDTDKKSQRTEQSHNNSMQPMPINYGTQYKQDIKHYIASEQIKPLLAGPDDYLTLVNKYTTANSKGAAILLPDWQQGATNPRAINFLRTELPANGWTTITIQPNSKPEGYPSTALKITEQQEQNKPLLAQYKNKLAVMFNAAINTAQEYPGIIIIIAQGNNGAFLVDLLSNNGVDGNTSITEPNAIILLSSYQQNSRELQPEINERLAQNVALLELPLLDLYLTYDHPLVSNNMALRASLSAQEMQVYYRQRQLNNTMSGYYPNKKLLNQINGWLKSIGW
jgi:hypothetical protein